MISISYLKLLSIFVALIFLPDFILSLSGRDTYLLHRGTFVCNIGLLSILFLCVIFFTELVSLFSERKFGKIFAYLVAVAVLAFLCQRVVNFLSEKSVAESGKKIGIFFSKKGTDSIFTVEIEEDAMQPYHRYLAKDFNSEDVELVWKSPQFGQYEFRISAKGQPPFFIRLSTRQSEADHVWIHIK